MGVPPAYLLTPGARDDLIEIWIYIASDNPAAADSLENDLFQAFEQLADRPELGHKRPDLTNKPIRFLTVRRTYLVAYVPDTEPLQIIRVLHGARNAGPLLE